MSSSYRFVIAAALVIAASDVSAQDHALDRGSFQVGGSASVVSSGSDGNDDRTTTITLDPVVRYFVIPRLALGVDLTFSHTDVGEATFRTLGIGPGATYYFGGPGARVHTYLSGSALLTRTELDFLDAASDGSGHALRGAAGIMTPLSSAVGLTTELFYRDESLEVDDDSADENAWGLAIGIAAFIF